MKLQTLAAACAALVTVSFAGAGRSAFFPSLLNGAA